METKMIYFIPDLFKPSQDEKNKKVDANDPFISEESIALYCDIQLPGVPRIPNRCGEGIDTPQTLGKDFFKGAIEIHSEREKEQLAEEAVQERISEEKLKQEIIVKKQLDAKVEKVLNHHKVYMRRSCPVKIPYKSQLTHAEHSQYMLAFIKYQKRVPKNSLEQQEFQYYMCLQNRVFSEQRELMQFAQKVSELQLEEYNKVPLAINTYVDRYLQHGYKRALDYPRLYHLEQEIPLRPQDPHNLFAGLTLDHKGHLLSLGVVPWIKVPYPNSRVVFPSDEDFLKTHPPEAAPKPKYPIAASIHKDRTFLNKTTVSKDPNCSFLAGQHLADIVLTSSALKMLLDNNGSNFEKEWDIPVIVRNVPVTESDGTVSQHRVVFIDKPMKKKIWTPLDKKALFYKKSGLATITSYRREALFKMRLPPTFHHIRIGRHADDCIDEVFKNSHSGKRSSRTQNIVVDRRSYARKNFVSFVSGNDGSSYDTSMFDDPFGAADPNIEEVDVFADVAQRTVPKNVNKTNKKKERTTTKGKRSYEQDLEGEDLDGESDSDTNKIVFKREFDNDMDNSSLSGSNNIKKRKCSSETNNVSREVKVESSMINTNDDLDSKQSDESWKKLSIDISKNDGNDISKDDGNDISKDDGNDISKDDGNDISKDDGNDISKDDGNDISKNDGNCDTKDHDSSKNYNNIKTESSGIVVGSDSKNFDSNKRSKTGYDNVLDELIDGPSPMYSPSSSTVAASANLGSNRKLGEQRTQDMHDDATGNKFPWDDKLDTDWDAHNEAVVPTPGTTLNYHYHLYECHSSSSGGPGIKPLPAITVLVRNKLHGLSYENVKDKVAAKSVPYILYPKLEHQVFFGCEVNTHSEIVQQWAALLLRPNTSILQVRVCSGDGEIVLGEQRDMSDVLKEGRKPHINFQPITALSSLYTTLHSLRPLSPGHYLLHHHRGNQAFIRLMKSVDQQSRSIGHQLTFDLHAAYGQSKEDTKSRSVCPAEAVNVIDSRKFTSPPWLAIDTHVLTPFHLKHRKIPATFPMDNPDKKLSKKEKRLKHERASKKKCIDDIEKQAPAAEQDEPKSDY